MIQKKDTRACMLYLGVVSFVAILGGFLLGLDAVVISGTVGFLKSRFALYTIRVGWVVSLALAGCIVGFMGATKLSGCYGRKKTSLLAALLFLVSAGGGWGLATTLLTDVIFGVQAPVMQEGKINSLQLQLTPFVRNTQEGPRQVLTGVVKSSGLKNAICRISKPEWSQPLSIHLGNLPAGVQRVTLPVPLVFSDGPVRVVLESDSDTAGHVDASVRCYSDSPP